MPQNGLSAEPQCEHVCGMLDTRGQDAGHTHDPIDGCSDAVLAEHLLIARFIVRRCLLACGHITGPSASMLWH